MKKKYVGVAEPPHRLDFFFLNVMGAFWEKNVKVVKLQQFESMGGLSVTFETLEIKMQIVG
jgi:hypothetical protein